MIDSLKKNKTKIISLVVISGLTAGFATEAGPDPETLKSFLSETAQSQIAQAGFFFTIAAWLHAGRVKKEIKSNFETLTTAINKVADAFREDLKVQREMLDNLKTRVQTLESQKTKE